MPAHVLSCQHSPCLQSELRSSKSGHSADIARSEPFVVPAAGHHNHGGCVLRDRGQQQGQGARGQSTVLCAVCHALPSRGWITASPSIHLHTTVGPIEVASSFAQLSVPCLLISLLPELGAHPAQKQLPVRSLASTRICFVSSAKPCLQYAARSSRLRAPLILLAKGLQAAQGTLSRQGLWH